MPSKKSLESAPGAPAAAPVAATPAAIPPRSRGLAIAGIAVGGVIIAGALFGGGVAVGAHLSDGDRFGGPRIAQIDHQRDLPGDQRAPLGDEN